MSELKSSDRTSDFPETSNDEENQQTSSEENNGRRREKKKKQPSLFDERAAREFAEVVKTHRKVQRNSDLRQWANVFRQMREVDGVEKKDIRETIQWYGNHIGDEFVPEAFSASTFRKKFAEGKFASAMLRSSRNGSSPSSNGRKPLTRETMHDDPSNVLSGGILRVEVGRDGKQYDGRVLYCIRKRIFERFGSGLPLPEQLEAVLAEEFPEAGKIPRSIIGSVG